jgi:hypothetical protein
MDQTTEYWKKRCELAEEVIGIWEPEHYPNNSWTLWMNFRSSGDIAVMLPKPVINKSFPEDQFIHPIDPTVFEPTKFIVEEDGCSREVNSKI